MNISFRTNGKQFVAALEGRVKKIEKVFQTALDKAEADILKRGQADIKSAGRFGSRWTRGLKVERAGGQTRASSGRFGSNEDRITVSHDIPYWTVHQYGKVIQGKPLLWIPLSGTDAEGIRARDYGPLFRVPKDRSQMTRKNGKAPLLLSFDGEPKYFGKQSVRIPKRFHIIEIAVDVASKMLSSIKQKLKGS